MENKISIKIYALHIERYLDNWLQTDIIGNLHGEETEVWDILHELLNKIFDDPCIKYSNVHRSKVQAGIMLEYTDENGIDVKEIYTVVSQNVLVNLTDIL